MSVQHPKLVVVLQRTQQLRVQWDHLLTPDVSICLVYHQRDSVELSVRAPQFEAVEVSDFSVENLAALITSLAKEASVDISEVRLCTNDEYCLELSGRLRATLGIPGPRKNDYVAFIDKLEMKKRLQRAGIRVPRFVPFDAAQFAAAPERYIADILGALQLPVMVKPVRGANNRGVQLLDSAQELYQWCCNSEKTESFQFEERILGKLYHCNSILRDKSIRLVQVCEYLWPCLEFGRGRPIGSITLDQRDEVYQRIGSLNDQVLRVLQPPEPCITHLEVFRTPEDDLVFLEIAARSPGALVPEMCERRTGIHLLEANLKLQMGSAEQLEMSPGPFSGWAWFPCRPGTVAATNELDLSCHHRVTWHARPGTRCEKDGIAIACEILFWHEDQRVLQRDAEYLRHWQPTVSET